MAKHKIFIGEYGVDRMRLGDSRSTDYSYDSDANVLTIYWCGKEVARCKNAEAGDAFLVICGGGEPQLQELHFPKHPNDFLMYIMGFGSGMRCHRWDYFDRALAEQRKAKLTADRTEYEISDQNFEFHVCEDKDGKPYHLAGIIIKDLDAEEYCRILCDWPYPIRYPNEFLRIAFRRKFGMNAEQTDRVFRTWDDKNRPQ